MAARRPKPIQPAKKHLRIAVLGLEDAVFWDGVREGVQAAAKELKQFNAEVEWICPEPNKTYNAAIRGLAELHDRSEAAALAWSALNIWPLLKRALAHERGSLSPRECECLSLAFEGMTARASGQKLACSERTVNYHLANAMAKLKVDNKMAAIQRACWLGAI